MKVHHYRIFSRFNKPEFKFGKYSGHLHNIFTQHYPQDWFFIVRHGWEEFCVNKKFVQQFPHKNKILDNSCGLHIMWDDSAPELVMKNFNENGLFPLSVQRNWGSYNIAAYF